MTRLSQNYATATNGHEAVLAYTSASGPFDVVFMDLQMPRMDGLAAAREIRKWEVENGVKPAAVVALTGAASGNARLEAFGSGMDLFLVKPVKMSVLMDVMVRLREGGRAALRGFG
jgi:CheY-like chemotaxis protein